MKRSLLTCLPAALSITFTFALAACGGGAPVSVTTPSGAAVPAAPTEKVAEKAGANSTTKESLDPLAVGGDLEASAVPTVVVTPAKEVRAKSRGDLDAAMKLLANETTPEGALKKVTSRLGKPSWTEGGKKRVWIANDGKSCHRFVLDADGQADVETASTTEWRMLTALAKQSACTGEIKRGALGD